MITALVDLVNSIGTLVTGIGTNLGVDVANATGGATPDGMSDVLAGLLLPLAPAATSGGLADVIKALGDFLQAVAL